MLLSVASAAASAQTVPDLSKPFNMGACMVSSQQLKVADDAATAARYAGGQGTVRAMTRDSSASSPPNDAFAVNLTMKNARDSACAKQKELWDDLYGKSVAAIVKRQSEEMRKALADSKGPKGAGAEGWSTYWVYCYASSSNSSQGTYVSAVFPLELNRTKGPMVSYDSSGYGLGNPVTRQFREYLQRLYGDTSIGGACSVAFSDEAAARKALQQVLTSPIEANTRKTMTEWKYGGGRITLPKE